MPVSAAFAQDPVPGSPISGDGVVPLEYDGNVSCQVLDLDYYGFKIEGQNAADYTGIFSFNLLNGGIHTGNAPDDSFNWVSTSSDDGQTLNWIASLGIDAVIMKGGPDSNAYVYFPEDNSDTGLASPDLDNGNLPAISHVEFCYDYNLEAVKTANTEFTRTYTWSIEKDVNDPAHSGFAGESFSSDYDITVKRFEADSDFAVSGSIKVSNPTPFTVGFNVSDVVDSKIADVNCGGVNELAPGADTTCTYSVDFGNSNPGAGINTATITSLNSLVAGASASAEYAFSTPTKIVGFETVNVTDTFPYPDGTSEALGSASGNVVFDNDQEFTCSKVQAEYENGTYSYTKTNRATIKETGQSADASVSVTCYAPVVTKTALASYKETHTWSIEKSVDPESQSGYPGDKLGWTWTVKVSETSADSNFAVSGTISVFNPADKSMTVVVSDKLNDGAGAIVDCGAGLTSLTVEAGQTAYCSYSAAPTGKTATLNTATATINGAGFSGTADVEFKAIVIGGTATVTDDQIGLDEALTAGEGPWTFKDDSGEYTCSLSYADYGADGSYSATLTNTAIVTDSKGNKASDDAKTTYTCEAGTVSLLKLTEGVVNDQKDWKFALYVDGFGGTQVGQTSSTSGDLDGVLDFGVPALSPDTTYSVCELNVPAGWSSEWKIDTDDDGIAETVVPAYNPNSDDPVPQDLGNRCFDFGFGTSYPVVVGKTLVFQVDNTFPGGEPRTPGYWKNWNTCTVGGQDENAARNGGFEEGYWLLDDILNDPGITWGDFTIETCEDGVSILDQRDLSSGKKMASDAAYTLAMHLLAAQLNFAAGAETCQAASDAVLAGEELLISIDFNGTSNYLRPKDALYSTALSHAATLDSYNNGNLCSP